MNFLKLIYERFTSDTPSFWNKVSAFGAALTVIGGGLLAAPENISIPGWLENIAGYLTTAGFVLGLFGQLTTKDTDLSEK